MAARPTETAREATDRVTIVGGTTGPIARNRAATGRTAIGRAKIGRSTNAGVTTARDTTFRLATGREATDRSAIDVMTIGHSGVDHGAIGRSHTNHVATGREMTDLTGTGRSATARAATGRLAIESVTMERGMTGHSGTSGAAREHVTIARAEIALRVTASEAVLTVPGNRRGKRRGNPEVLVADPGARADREGRAVHAVPAVRSEAAADDLAHRAV
jgi:hypothetical protein